MASSPLLNIGFVLKFLRFMILLELLCFVGDKKTFHRMEPGLELC